MAFARPFWTEAGVPHVIAVPSSGRAPVHGLLGADTANGDPVLVFFGFGSTHEWLEHDDQTYLVEQAMELLDELFGSKVLKPVGVVRSEWWRDPFSRGSYTYLAEGATPDDLEHLGQPHAGRILFAGEATGYARAGFADGALLTGIREAKRLTERAEVELGRI